MRMALSHASVCASDMPITPELGLIGVNLESWWGRATWIFFDLAGDRCVLLDITVCFF